MKFVTGPVSGDRKTSLVTRKCEDDDFRALRTWLEFPLPGSFFRGLQEHRVTANDSCLRDRTVRGHFDLDLYLAGQMHFSCELGIFRRDARDCLT